MLTQGSQTRLGLNSDRCFAAYGLDRRPFGPLR